MLYSVYWAVNKDTCPVSFAFPPVMESKIVLSQENYYTMSRSAGATSWLPDCSH